MRHLTYSSMMTIDFVLVAAAGTVLAFPAVLFLIIRGKQTGPKVASRSGLIGTRAHVNGEAAHPSENLESKRLKSPKGRCGIFTTSWHDWRFGVTIGTLRMNNNFDRMQLVTGRAIRLELNEAGPVRQNRPSASRGHRPSTKRNDGRHEGYGSQRAYWCDGRRSVASFV